MSQESTEMAKIADAAPSKMSERFQPKDFGQLQAFSKMLVNSSLTPSSVKTANDAMIIIIQGAELGLAPMQAVRNIHVIKGKPSLSAKLKVALVRQLPQCEYFECIEWTREKATFETKRKGARSSVKYTFTIDDAKRAKLIKSGGNWDKYPDRMVWSRAASGLADAEYPEILAGLYTPDENFHVGDAEVVGDDDLNERFGANTPDDEVIDAEFDEPEEPEETSEDDARAEQRRRLGQLIRHTDDLDTTDDKTLIEKALRCAADKDDLESVDTKSLTLLINAIAKADGTADDGPSPRRLLLLEWAGVPLNGPDLDDEEFEV